MSRITYTAPLLISLVALIGCPGDDTSVVDTDDPTGTSTGPGTATGPGTNTMTTTVDPDSTTADGSTTNTDDCEEPCGAGECCVAGSCFGPPDPACDGGCAEGEECQYADGSDECDGIGMCVGVDCGVPGNYGNCANDMDMPDTTLCEMGSICVSGPDVTACALQDCSDVCECPVAPETGDAPVTCEDVTADMVNDCYLDCSGGETCPDSMICFGGFVCVHPVGDPPPEEPLWGDCGNGAVCETGSFCITAPDGTWCSAACADITDCEPVPGTGDAPAACADVTGDMMPECILSCMGGETCPDGMICFGDQVCVWPEIPDPEEGYGNCGLPGGECSMGAVCLDDQPMMGMDPAWTVCSEAGCADASECLQLAPATGDAPITCADPAGMGGPNTCYLDCAGGQTCPDGMSCIDSSWCAWEQGMSLFEDDFESGDFMMGGWTLNDVDAQPVDMNVAFVTDAWVVSDQVDGMGVNLSATSTSWYDPVGQSDDWLISPQIMAGPNTRVYWSARSFSEGFPDGYELRISTAGTDPADFMANVELFTIGAETVGYSDRFVDLAAAGYADMPVYLAWRNVTNDGFLLAVDNVAVVEMP